LEDLEGASHCVTTVKQLKVNCTAGDKGQPQPTTTALLQQTTTPPTPTLETIQEEELETEEDILARQVDLSQPAAAKKMANTLLQQNAL
jgi:hypothetical protein